MSLLLIWDKGPGDVDLSFKSSITFSIVEIAADDEYFWLNFSDTKLMRPRVSVNLPNLKLRVTLFPFLAFWIASITIAWKRSIASS